MTKPRFYSTVPTEQLRRAFRDLPPQQLRLWLFLEFKAGSDQSGIESDDPSLSGLRYVRMGIPKLRERLGLGDNRAVRRLLDQLLKKKYIVSWDEEIVLLEMQGKVDRYTENYGAILDLEHHKLLLTLLANKRRQGSDLVVQACRRFLLNARCGGGQGRGNRLKWINDGLAQFEQLGFLTVVEEGPPVLYRINPSAIAKWAAKQELNTRTLVRVPYQKASKESSKYGNGCNIQTRRNMAAGATSDMAAGATKENPLLKNPGLENPSERENPSEKPSEGLEPKETRRGLSDELESLPAIDDESRQYLSDYLRRIKAPHSLIQEMITIEAELGFQNTIRFNMEEVAEVWVDFRQSLPTGTEAHHIVAALDSQEFEGLTRAWGPFLLGRGDLTERFRSAVKKELARARQIKRESDEHLKRVLRLLIDGNATERRLAVERLCDMWQVDPVLAVRAVRRGLKDRDESVLAVAEFKREFLMTQNLWTEKVAV